MRRYLLDTGMMGDFINRRRGADVKVHEVRLEGSRIGTCMPVVGELFFGVERSAPRAENLTRLQRALSHIVCWPYDRAAAEQYGRIAAELKLTGRTIQQIDIQIAAITLAFGDC